MFKQLKPALLNRVGEKVWITPKKSGWLAQLFLKQQGEILSPNNPQVIPSFLKIIHYPQQMFIPNSPNNYYHH